METKHFLKKKTSKLQELDMFDVKRTQIKISIA